MAERRDDGTILISPFCVCVCGGGGGGEEGEGTSLIWTIGQGMSSGKPRNGNVNESFMKCMQDTFDRRSSIVTFIIYLCDYEKRLHGIFINSDHPFLVMWQFL